MEQEYQFLQKGSEQQYEVLIRNYLSLGQFELARASIVDYHSIAPKQCLALLKSFITSDPPSHWLLSKSVPSTSHLIWLCLGEYKNLLPSNLELDLPKAFTEQLEFDVLLEAALHANDTEDNSESFTENVIHELRTCSKATESSSPSLSSGTLSRLRNVAALQPGLGASLTRALAPRASRALVELSAQLIADLLSAQHREEALQFVQLLNAAQRNDRAALDADELVALFKQLIALYGNEQETGPWRQRLYSALLAHCSDNENRLVAQFARVEDELLSRAHKDAPLNAAFDHVRALVASDLNGQTRDAAQEAQQLSRFWRDFYHVMRVTNQHGLEFVLTRAIECVNAGQFEECAVVLRPFERLKPLVLLMVWDKFETDFDARVRLMNLLWHQGGKQEAKDKDVALKCDILDYSIRVSQWTAEQLLKDNENEVKIGTQKITKKGNQSLQQFTTAITNALHNELKVHSIAFALQSVCHRLEDQQVSELLRANPDHSEISVSEQTQDLVLLNTYFVIKAVMVMFDHVVKSANVDQTLLDQQCQVATDYIAKISDNSTLTGLAETLLAFVFQKKSAWQLIDPKQRDLFVATPALVKSLLDLANQCLTRVSVAHDTSTEFKHRLEALQQFWREFTWRYELIASLRLTVGVDVSKYYGTEAKNRHFVNLMLASPTTLLIMCVREKDFNKCKAVIKFFDLTARDTELARLAEEFNNIITKIGDKVSKESFGELLSKDLSPTDAFNVCADFALTRAQTREQSELFLDHASQLLQQQIKQHGGDFGNKRSAKKGNVPSHLTNFENYLTRLKLLQSSQLEYPQRLSSRLLSTEFFPVDAKALKAFLGNRTALRAAVSALHTAIKDPQQRAALDSLLRRVNLQLSGGGAHDTSDKSKSHAYVHRIVRHLLLIGDALASDKFFGSKDYATHLKRTPAQILAELVFKSRNYEQAEDLATELGLELTAVILSHLEADRTGVSEKKSSSSLNNKSLSRQSSLPGLLKSSSSVTAISTPSRQLSASGTSYSTSLKSPSPSPSFLSTSFSARDSYFDDFDRGDEHGAAEQSKSFDQGTSPHDVPSSDQAANQSGKYHLDIEVINYIAKQSPLLASLASLLRSPTSRFDPEFLETALSRSRRYPSLFNWICSRARTYGVFRAVFLQPHPSFDGLARQLDPNNYAFLNLENTKKGKKKRQSSSRQDDGSELSRSVKSSAAEEFDDLPSPSPSPSHVSKSLKVDAFRGHGHRRMKSSGEHFEGDWPPSLGSVGPGERFLTFESVNYIRAKDQKFLDTIFSEDDIRQEQEFYSTLLDKMVLAGAHEEAIRLADVTMPLGAPDFLLRLVVERAEDKTRVTEYLLRMQDKKQCATLVLQHLNAWPLDVALDLLYMCKCHLTMTPGDALIERIELHHTKLQLFKDILSDANNVDKWKRWQQLEQWCLKDPVSVIKHLLLSSHFDLAARVAAQFRVTSMKKEIEEQSLLHLLNDTHDIAKVRQRLAAMGPESITVAESLLDHVKQPETIMFLIQYLMEYKSALAAALNNSNAPSNDKELGIKVLVLLPPAQQKVFKGLLNQPLLVVESLLMSEQTSTLVPVFKEIPQIRNDELIVSYANKALELPQDRAGTSEYRQWVLDETNADSLRKKHSYPSAPNHVLATAILDLCYDAKRVAKWCVDGAAKLSTFAFGTSSNQASNEVTNQLTQSGSMTPVKGDTSQWTKAEAMSAVSHLLYYAKVRLNRESESLSGDSQVISMTEMIDMTLSRLDLLRRLILLTGIDRAREDKNGLRHKLPFNLDLNALNDPVKARQLRDELIDEDRMDEAIEVANKCNVEREPVWAAWGLSLLKMGKYEQAKEKFKYSLTPQEPRRATGAPPVNRALLTRIINVLESDAPLDPFNLRQKYEELSQRLANKAGTKKAAKTFDDTMSFESYLHVLQVSPQKKKVEPASNAARNPVAVVKRQLNLDSVRYMQCIYYLQNYGTPNDLLAFWLRHQLLEDACRYVLSYCHQLASQAAAADQNAMNSNATATNAGNQLFIDLVLYILAHNKLKEFKEILLKIDPQLGKWRECLLATCRYFNVRKESVLLLEFQVLMRDFIRTGLTCIKLFERNEDLSDKINYLNLAKQHLQQGLEEYQTEVNKQGGTVSINSNILGTKSISDIHRYVKTINLQLEVTKFMQQLLAKNKGAKTLVNTSTNNIVEPEQSEQSEEDGQGKKKKQKNSLFGTTQAKSIIAERMLVEHNFDLGFKIVQEFHLPMARIYNNALLKLAQSKQTKFVNELLKSIKPFLNDDEWDPILSAIVQVYVEQNQDPNTAEKFATNIKSEESKAMALLLCGKLKSAYLSAIKTNNLNTVLAIRDEAKKRGAKRELELCEKFIASKSSQGAVTSNTNTSGNNTNQ